MTMLVEQSPTFFISYILLILVLLMMSGLISGSEVAFFSLKANDIDEEEKDAKIKLLLEKPRKLLATILILNNLINVFIVTISTYATWQLVGDKNAGGAAIAVLTTIITILIIFFGEIVPKVFASHDPIRFARITARFLFLMSRVLQPISWFLISVSNVVERRVQRKGYNVSVDELNQALDITTEGETTEEEKGILKGIVNFGTLSVKQIMRSRVDITAFDMEIDFHELMDQINKTGFSRIPVYNETIDKVEGVLYIKDILPHVNEDENFNWQEKLRPVFFVPESKKIDDLFKDFQEKQVHMAIVIDEYGGTEGLITMEDIIEEIVGDINDEFDEEIEVNFRKIDKNTYIFEGKTSLNDFCKILQVESALFDPVKGESESLGGLLLEIDKKLPYAGEQIEYANFMFTIVAVDQKRIKRIRVVNNDGTKDNSSLYED
ncbi:MAG: putative hemolysin [Cyclobacteriaceae bacterium]|jgi:putative hemolysin